MADGPVYGYPQRPPMPDRFVPGTLATQGSSPSASMIPVVPTVTTPRNQLPRAVDNEVKYGDLPSMMIGWPQHRGVVVENTTVTAPTDTAENTLKSTFIWAGTLSYRGGWRLTASGTASGVSTKSLKVYWGGILIGTMSIATLTRAWSVEVTAWNQNDTRSQVVTVKMTEFPQVGTTNAAVIEIATVTIESVDTA